MKAEQIKNLVNFWIRKYSDTYAKPLVVYMYPADKSLNLSKGLALIRFLTLQELRAVYSALKFNNSSLLNERKDVIKVGISYDKRQTGELFWVGCTLRNIPKIRVDQLRQALSHEKMQEAQIKTDIEFPPYLKHMKPTEIEKVPYRLKNILKPVCIKDQWCSIVQVQDIEEAERFCKIWDSFYANQNQIKVDIHPFSYRKRPRNKMSKHPIFKDFFTEPPEPQKNDLENSILAIQRAEVEKKTQKEKTPERILPKEKVVKSVSAKTKSPIEIKQNESLSALAALVQISSEPPKENGISPEPKKRDQKSNEKAEVKQDQLEKKLNDEAL